MPAPGARVAFADQLRGAAAVLVVLSHHLGFFWHAQGSASNMTGVPPAFAAPPPSMAFAETILNGPLQFGAGGVALFFLISGYVIPFSLRGRSRGSFLLARAVRLMPTYWAGFALQLGVVLLALHWLGGTLARSGPELAANLFPGAPLLLGWPTMDGIVWTLEIEVIFYLLLALAAPALASRSPRFLAVPLAVGAVGAALALFPGWQVGPPGALRSALAGLSFAAPMLLFMMVGTVLHLAEGGGGWRRHAPVLVAALLAGFAALMRWWPPARIDGQIPSYFLAAAVFGTALRLRDRIPAWRWPTRLAALSYPLYVVHGVSGFAIMAVLASLGWAPWAMIAAALAWSFGAALLLHVAVEVPTRRLSSGLGRS